MASPAPLPPAPQTRPRRRSALFFFFLALAIALSAPAAYLRPPLRPPAKSQALRRCLLGGVALAGVAGAGGWLDVRGGSVASAEVVQGRFCEDTLSHLSGPDGDVFLVGVAHLSNRSAELVRLAIRKAAPDLVMVEMDRSRVNFGGKKQQAEARQQSQVAEVSDGNPFEAVKRAAVAAAREATAAALRSGLELLYKVGEKYMDTTAGSEMLAAIQEATSIGVPVMLGDQPAQQTLLRLADEAGKTDVRLLEEDLQMVPELQFQASSGSDFQSALESIRDQATAQRLRRVFKRSAPGLFGALVGERDIFMAENLNKALKTGKRRIVAVVGSIHVAGISERLLEIADLRPVDACIA